MHKKIIYLAIVAISSSSFIQAGKNNTSAKKKELATKDLKTLVKNYTTIEKTPTEKIAQLKQLIADGADVDALIQPGLAVLHVAVTTLNPQFLKIILDADANPFVTDDENLTPRQRVEKILSNLKRIRENGRAEDIELLTKSITTLEEEAALLENAEARRIPAAPPAPLLPRMH